MKFKVLPHELLTHGSIYTLSSLLTTLIPFILLPVLTKHLTPEAYGIAVTFTLICQIFGVIVGLNGAGAIAVNFLRLDYQGRKAYITNTLLILFLSYIIILLITICFGKFISNIIVFPRSWLPAVVTCAFFSNLYIITLSVLQMEKKPIIYGTYQILFSIINFGLSLFFVISLNMSWKGRVVAVFLTYFLIGISGFIHLVKKNYIGAKLFYKDTKDILLFGIPLIPHSMSGWAMNAIGRIFINKMASVSATGIFTVGYQIGQIIGLLAQSFNQAWSPYFYQQLNNISEQKKSNIVRITYIYFIAVIFITLMLSFISPFLLNIIVGEEFRSASKYIIWIASGYAMKGMYFMVVGYIFFVKKTYVLSIITISTGAINIFLNYFFIKWYGPIGSAVSTFVTFTIAFISTFIVSQFLYPMPWLSFFKHKQSLVTVDGEI